MKILKVYDTSPGDIPKSAVEVVTLPFTTFAFSDECCNRCALGKGNTAPIKRPFSYDENKTGKALLVVVSQAMGANNKVMSFLYSTISKIWKGPIYFDFAVRCASVLNDISPTTIFSPFLNAGLFPAVTYDSRRIGLSRTALFRIADMGAITVSSMGSRAYVRLNP